MYMMDVQEPCTSVTFFSRKSWGCGLSIKGGWYA